MPRVGGSDLQHLVRAESEGITSVRISVVMATFNGARFLAQQLQSLLDQTLTPFELIIGDDGSCDETIAICRAFASRSPFPVRIQINESRLGFVQNFLQSAERCKGEIIAFCDQDDVWYPAKLQAIAQAMSSSRITMSFHDAETIDQHGNVIKSLNAGKGRRPLSSFVDSSPWDFPLGFTIAFRAELITFGSFQRKTVNYYWDNGNPLAHDQWITLIASLTGEVAYIDQILAGYRQHSNNTFGAKPKNSDEVPSGRFVAWSDYRVLQISLKQLQNLIPDIARQATEEQLSYLKGSAAACKTLVDLYSKRVKIYSDKHVLRRLLGWIALAAAGRYGGANTWRFHRKALTKDLAAGVIAGSLTPGRRANFYGDDTLCTPPSILD